MFMDTLPNPEDALDVIRASAKLDGRSIELHGRDYQDAVRKQLFTRFLENANVAWDVLDSAFPGAQYQENILVIEMCSGDDPFIKGFLRAQKIPAFELRPEIPKKKSLATTFAVQAFSLAVEALAAEFGYYHSRYLSPGVPLMFYQTSRNSPSISTT